MYAMVSFLQENKLFIQLERSIFQKKKCFQASNQQMQNNEDVYNYTYKPPTLNTKGDVSYPEASAGYHEPSPYEYQYGSASQPATHLPPPPIQNTSHNEAPAQQVNLSKLELQSKISGVLNVVAGSLILALTIISALLWLAGLIGNVTLIWWSLIFYAVDLLMHIFYCGGAAFGIGSGILYKQPEKLNLRYGLSVVYASFLIIVMIVHLVIRPVLFCID